MVRMYGIHQVTSLCPSQYPTNATVYIDGTIYNVTVSPTDVDDGLLTLTIDIDLMHHGTVTTVVYLDGGIHLERIFGELVACDLLVT